MPYVTQGVKGFYDDDEEEEEEEEEAVWTCEEESPVLSSLGFKHRTFQPYPSHYAALCLEEMFPFSK